MASQPTGTDPVAANGRTRWLKFLDLVLASLNPANGRVYGALCIWTLVLAIFYGMTQDILAESKRDHEFFREEVRRMRDRDQDTADAIKAAVNEMRQFNAEMRKKEREAKP